MVRSAAEMQEETLVSVFPFGLLVDAVHKRARAGRLDRIAPFHLHDLTEPTLRCTLH